jgi:hypothetical protein
MRGRKDGGKRESTTVTRREVAMTPDDRVDDAMRQHGEGTRTTTRGDDVGMMTRRRSSLIKGRSGGAKRVR